MNVAKFFWPTARNETNDPRVRLGRVAHWIGIALSVATLLLWFSGMHLFADEPKTTTFSLFEYTVEDENAVDPSVVTLALAIGWYAIGRAVRYVLSDE